MKNGNVVEYVCNHPHVKPARVGVYDFWGMYFFLIHFFSFGDAPNGPNYLQSRGLVRGDLRAVCPICLRDDASYSSVT